MVYDGIAESVQVAITRWQTSQVAEPLSRAGKLTVTRYSVPQWEQAKPLSPLRVIRTIFFNSANSRPRTYRCLAIPPATPMRIPTPIATTSVTRGRCSTSLATRLRASVPTLAPNLAAS